MKIIHRKYNALLIYLFLSISICTETLTDAKKHYKNFSSMLNEFKNKYGDSENNENDNKSLQPINFIEKSEDKVNDVSNSNDKSNEFNSVLTPSFVEKKNIVKKAKSTKKQGRPRPKDITYKIVKEKNSLLPNKKKLKFSYKKCSVRTGKINFITKRPTSPKNIITVMPVFIMITTDKLILTKDEKRSNFIRSIPLVEVQRIDQHYVKTFCFDIILNEIVEKKLTAGQLSLCANNDVEMNMWVNEILSFKKCSLNGINSVDHNGKIILDLAKINSYTKKSKGSISKLFYNGKDKATRPSRSRKSSVIKKTLTKIISQAQKGELAAHQLRRQFAGRLMKARAFEQTIEGRQFNLKRLLSNRMFREKEQEASEYSRRNTRKELKILKNVQNEMSSMQMSELTEYTKLSQRTIRMQQEKIKNRAKILMNMVNEQDKLTDYRVCFDESLKHFKNQKMVSRICKKYYGEYGHNLCEEKSSFCSMCCDYHIGVNLASQRFKCRRKCQKIISPKKNLKNKIKSKKYTKKNNKNNKNNKKSLIESKGRKNRKNKATTGGRKNRKNKATTGGRKNRKSKATTGGRKNTKYKASDSRAKNYKEIKNKKSRLSN